MERFPAGIGEKGFIQKDVSKGFPDWLQRVEVPKKDGVVHYPIVTDTRSLLWMANQNCITPHVWTSRVPDLYHPDICVFDLDPSGMIAACCAPPRLQLRDCWQELGLPSWVKTSGSKGFHIVVPLDGKADMGEVYAFATCGRDAAGQARSGEPHAGVHKADRGGREFSSTPDATATARHSRLRMRFARSRARRCPRPARGTK